MLWTASMADDTKDVISSGAGLAAVLPAEGALDTSDAVVARGYWEQVWRRFKRDKVAMAGGVFIIFLFVVAYVGAPIAAHVLGHGPDDQFAGALDPKTLLPVGPWTHVSTLPYVGAVGHFGTTLFVLGGDGQLGRDEFLRLLYGAQTSLEVAIGATVLSMVVGVIMGAMAGYFGGVTDTVVSRLTEIVMAFPILLFIIALASTAGDRLNRITLGGLFGEGVVTLILVLGFFGWYYPARIVRAQVLSLREKEFIEAARMVGAHDWRIIRSHLLPHLVAPIIVLSTITIAQFILAEAGLSFLGIGIQEPLVSWGTMMREAQSLQTLGSNPWLMWPAAFIVFAVIGFNFLGDGLRDAVDPYSIV